MYWFKLHKVFFLLLFFFFLFLFLFFCFVFCFVLFCFCLFVLFFVFLVYSHEWTEAWSNFAKINFRICLKNNHSINVNFKFQFDRSNRLDVRSNLYMLYKYGSHIVTLKYLVG